MGKHVRMPCGWGCGEELTAREVREHFARCPRREQGGEAAPPVRVESVKPPPEAPAGKRVEVEKLVKEGKAVPLSERMRQMRERT